MTDEVYQYQLLLNEMDKISKLHEQEWRKSGKYFNVFSALGVERKEIRHSALLASFLNPNAFHGMSDIFLKEFMKRIGFYDFPTKDAIVYTEEVISNYRRFDIDICSVDGRQKVVIENKIGIADHDNQLNAYFEDLGKQNLKNYKLVYLTLNGDEPTETISDEDKKDLICLSYKDDVIQIIDTISSIGNMLPQPVLEIFRQYCLTLKNLTNQGVDKIMNEEITELLLNGNNLELAEKLYKQIEPIKIQALTDFLSLLETVLKAKGYNVEITDNSPGNAARKYIGLKSAWIALKFPLRDEKNFFITFDPDNDEFWYEIKTNNESDKEATDKVCKAVGTDFKSLYIQFKTANDGFKKFVLMSNEEKKKYVTSYVDDIEMRLRNSGLF